jgi:hypothetical protein
MISALAKCVSVLSEAVFAHGDTVSNDRPFAHLPVADVGACAGARGADAHATAPPNRVVWTDGKPKR